MNKLTEESIKQQVKAMRYQYPQARTGYWKDVAALCDTVETLLRALQLARPQRIHVDDVLAAAHQREDAHGD